MTELWQRVTRLFAFVLIYFRPRRETPPPSPPPIEPAPKRSRVRTPRARVSMRLKAAILDQLDDNTKIVGRMKAFFPSEYGLYSQIGAVIVPHDDPFIPERAELAADPVSPWFLQLRPAFGAVVTGNPRDETKARNTAMYPRLTHFLKIEHPKERRRHMFRDGGHINVQPIASTSDFYVFTLYFDERDWARLFPRKTREDWKMCKFYERAFALELPLEITKDGDVRPLRITRDKYVPAGRHSSYGDVRRTVQKWDYPFSKEWIAAAKSNLTPQQYVLAEIGFTLWSYEAANASMIQVRASKSGVCTLVNINVEQTPGFFEDRDDVIVDGVKKRIFHVVRAHERIGSKGVRLHFRGLREFLWNGYAIEISVPGRDHLDLREFNATAIDGEDERRSSEFPEVARFLVANQKARFGAMVGKGGPMIPLRSEHDTPPAP